MIRFEIIRNVRGDNQYEIFKCWDNLLTHKKLESDGTFTNISNLVADELSKYNGKILDNHLEFEDETQASMFVLRWS